MNVKAPSPNGGLPPDSSGRRPPTRILIVIYGDELGRRHDIVPGNTTIGRSAENGVVLDQPGVSREHATLSADSERVTIRDLGSRNGTFVDGERVEQSVLQNGAQIRISSTILKFLEGSNVDLDYNEELYRLSSVDGLTALSNRRSFADGVERAIEAAKAAGGSLGLILLDVEGMTSLNEVYGHEAGDHVLRQIAGRIRTHVGPEDSVGRVGGDEFAVILPGVDQDRCIRTAETLLHLIAEERIEAGAHSIHAEVSVGCAMLGTELGSYDSLLEAARKELNEIRRARITSTFEEDQ